MDLITACDIRYCAQDAFFQVKVSHPSKFLLPQVYLELDNNGRVGAEQGQCKLRGWGRGEGSRVSLEVFLEELIRTNP